MVLSAINLEKQNEGWADAIEYKGVTLDFQDADLTWTV